MIYGRVRIEIYEAVALGASVQVALKAGDEAVPGFFHRLVAGAPQVRLLLHRGERAGPVS